MLISKIPLGTRRCQFSAHPTVSPRPNRSILSTFHPRLYSTSTRGQAAEFIHDGMYVFEWLDFVRLSLTSCHVVLYRCFAHQPARINSAELDAHLRSLQGNIYIYIYSPRDQWSNTLNPVADYTLRDFRYPRRSAWPVGDLSIFHPNITDDGGKGLRLLASFE